LQVADGSAALIGMLTAVWERLLDRSPLGPDENFFDLGGDSLLAMELVVRIKEASGCELPVALIFEAPTIASLAAAVRKQIASPLSPVVSMKPGTDGLPLFLIPDISGVVMGYAALVRNIEVAFPIYAIRPKGAQGRDQPLMRVEDMADYNIEHIRTVRGGGPFRLAGYSFGGLVAFEMARRLVAAGEDVELLALIDSYPNERLWPPRCRIDVMARQLIRRITTMQNLTWRELGPYVAERCRGLVDYLRRCIHDPHPGLALDPASLQPSSRTVFAACWDAMAVYRPGYYDGRLAFLQPTQRDLTPHDPRKVWLKFARQVDVHVVPGSHSTMMSADVASVAGCLMACLEATDRSVECI
jgi:acetoacetyl-CoA synthetase